VLEELYAGAGDRDRHIVERLERDFERAKRVLVPNLSDWTQSGRVLARLAAKYDYKQIGQGRLTNAMSAGDYRPSRPHSEFTGEGSRARTPLLMGMPSRFRHLVQVVHERAHCAIKTMDLGI
jgi:hypothetical protein